MKLLPTSVKRMDLDDYSQTEVATPKSFLRHENLPLVGSDWLSWREVFIIPTTQITKPFPVQGWQLAVLDGAVKFALDNDIRYMMMYSGRSQFGWKNNYVQHDFLVPLPSRHKVKLEHLFEKGQQVNAETKSIGTLVYGPPTELKRPKVHEYLFAQAIDKTQLFPIFDHLEERYPFDARRLNVSARGTRKNLHDAHAYVVHYEQKNEQEHVLLKF